MDTGDDAMSETKNSTLNFCCLSKQSGFICNPPAEVLRNKCGFYVNKIMGRCDWLALNGNCTSGDAIYDLVDSSIQIIDYVKENGGRD